MVERPNLQYLKKQAKALKRLLSDGDAGALRRFLAVFQSSKADYKLADCQHVIALEQGYESWPKMKFSIETNRMTRSERVQLLTSALFYGQHYRVERLLEMDPSLGDDNAGIQTALYKKDETFRKLNQNPKLISEQIGTRSVFLHFCYSKHFQKNPEKINDMMAIAQRMIELGADVNDSFEWDDGSPLSALYGALGHADNLRLAELLLRHGANPNDGECLYHACELGHLEGLKLLMRYNVDVTSNHHWIRMLDFDNYEGAKLLLNYGAPANTVMDDGTPLSSLHHAIKRGRDRRFAELLLDHGADVTAVEDGHSVYGFAYLYNNEGFCQVLKERGLDTPLSVGEEFIGAIMRSDISAALNIKQKHPDILDRLIRKDAGVPAYLAMTSGHISVFETMHDAGFDLNHVEDEYEMPILHIAAWNGQADYVSYFLQFAPDLERVNKFGGTALGTAIHGSQHCPDRDKGDYIKCIELLLDAGAKIKTEDGHLTMGSEEVSDYLEARVSDD